MYNVKVSNPQELVRRHGELYEHARKYLSSWLSEVHGVQADQRYWETLVHYFLCHRGFCSKYLQRWNVGLLNGSPDVKFILKHFPTLTDASFKKESYIYELNRSPFVLENIIPSQIPRLLRDRTQPKTSVADLVCSVRSYKRSRKDLILNQHVHEPGFWTNIVSQPIENFISIPNLEISDISNPNWKLRRDLAQLDRRAPLREYQGFWASLAISLPMELLENFTNYRYLSSILLDEIQPEHMLSSILWSMMDRCLAAQLIETKSILHLHQHGGGYGRPEHLASIVETRISDRYYTWGWTGNCTKLHSIPPLRMEAIKKDYERKSKENDKILILGNDRPPAGQFLSGTDGYTTATDKILDFYKNLSLNDRRRVLYRPRSQHSFNVKAEKALIDSMPLAEVATGDIPITDAYARAEYVVCEYANSTSEVECRILGIPFFCLEERAGADPGFNLGVNWNY